MNLNISMTNILVISHANYSRKLSDEIFQMITNYKTIL